MIARSSEKEIKRNELKDCTGTVFLTRGFGFRINEPIAELKLEFLFQKVSKY